MATTKFRKDGRVSITGLTEKEYDMICECVNRCQMYIGWDETEGCASDGGDFIWVIDDRQDFDTLQNLNI